MIKVVITGPPQNGYFPYRVDWFLAGRPQIVGASPAPLLDAARKLKQMGLMDSTVLGLFEQGEHGDVMRFRSTVGEGRLFTR